MRNRGHLCLAAAMALLLSDCVMAIAATQDPVPTKSQLGPAGLPDSFAGAWFVTAVFPHATSHDANNDRHIGTAVLLESDVVGDVNGHRCSVPTLAKNTLTAAAANLKWRIDGHIERLQVTCAGKVFATYLKIPGRSLPNEIRPNGTGMFDKSAPILIAQRPEALYLLERAEQVLSHQINVTSVLVPPSTLSQSALATETSMQSAVKPATVKSVAVTPDGNKTGKALAMKSMPAMGETNASMKTTHDSASKDVAKAPANGKTPVNKEPAGKPSVAEPTNVVPRPNEAIHLASYREMTTATRGWEILRHDYPELAPLKPLYVAIDIAGKGKMIRLYGTGAPAAKLQEICSDLQSEQAYCALNP